MIEVDSLRRNYNFGPYDASYAMGAHNPFVHGSLGVPPIPDNHRALIHWNQTADTPGQSADTTKPGSKSDEEDEDEDDEDRPFTPPPPRERLSYTRYQLELLNGIYNEVRYPNSTQKQLIAKRVGITREQVKIWFQNRRRKDVVGTSGKSKSCDTSTSSTGSQDSSQPSPKSDEMDSVTSDDNVSIRHDSPEPPKDAEETVVPSVVMKSIIGELHKFLNDPLKGRKKKDKKKAKAKMKEKANKVKKGLTSTLLAGNYDMISPPNQIVPQAFFDKVKTGFNHSKASSAFANPRENKQPTQIGSVSTTSGNSPPELSRDRCNNNKSAAIPSFNGSTPYPFQSQHGQRPPMFPGQSVFPPQGSANGCDIPILSDLLAYRSPLDINRKKAAPPPTTSLPSHLTSPLQPRQSGSGSEQDKSFHAINSQAMHSFNSGRPLNGIFPYPFLAEHNVFMSSLRQPDHILRPSPHYPPTHYSEDPYQPLLISSFSNPFFTSTPTSWTSTGIQNPPPTSVYAPL